MKTETLDARYLDLDKWPTESAVQAMLEGQMAAIAAIQSQTAAIARAAEAAAARLGHEGRLIYVGAGTSGRLAVQDGTELNPTFNWPMKRLIFLMAGGYGALTQAYEGAEDNTEAARADIDGCVITPSDVVIGVAASGSTPYTVAAIEHARTLGALTIGISNNAGTPLIAHAEHHVLADTGSEVLAGSTRMKAGTAQKAVLNLLSTALMLRLGFVYRGRMVAMRVSNAKLLQRGRRMIQELAGVEAEVAIRALDVAGNDIRRGVLVAMGVSLGEADALLDAHHGSLRAVLQALDAPEA
ncbi:N-acetylmuramic acid 6-phosphate etherase [Sphingomonas sp. SORGH_AS_0870]|uniref:N-acetylmuramic acid 6-phosphate etherase n=1 Tax=Sphingomonas sp. SORGH_AS_0870 TaxID=3041801 RepID=UPI00286AFF2C|nr:N-acetylmuramic acid 6-phosphate etherase [Sphingomonas sp. SORGH_AS_0870]